MTIEERADRIYHQEGKLDKHRQGYYDYVCGAIDQDPISRAEQKKIDIEKACDYVEEHICEYLSKAIDGSIIIRQDFFRQLKQAMEE